MKGYEAGRKKRNYKRREERRREGKGMKKERAMI